MVVRKSSQPADQILSDFFRKKKNIGSKERKFCSELIFSLLRNEHLAKSLYNNYLLTNHFQKIKINNNFFYNDVDISNEIVLLAFYIMLNITSNSFKYINVIELLKKVSSRYDDNILIFNEINQNFELFFSFDECASFINEFDKIFIDKLNRNDFSDNDIENYYSLPIFVFNKLYNSLSLKEVVNLADSLCYSAFPCLRLNNPIFLSLVIEELNKNNIPFQLSNISPLAIILNKRINLNEYDFFKKGYVDVQDHGSQLISYALNPTEGSRILDACAGAGGKSLHLASITNDNAEIIANDAEFSRMKELNSRARRAGFSSISIKNLNNPKTYRDYYSYFDYVLIDAPCSGIGTARRSPLMKYRLNQKILDKLNKTQLEIINYYSKLLKSGGILVYATCSFLPQENIEIVKQFLSSNSDFEFDFLKPAFDENEIQINGINENSFDLTLYPNIHNTDAFYMCRLQKK